MERNLSFAPSSIQNLVVKLAWAQLEMFTDEVEEIQVLIAGDDRTVSELKVSEKEGRLLVEQPTYGLSMDIVSSKWMQVCLRIPRAWRGGVDASTLSGLLSARGLRGGDLVLDTVSGDLRALDMEGITLTLRTVSGDLKAGGLSSDKLALRTVSGDIHIQGSCCRQVKATAVSGTQVMEFAKPFDRVDVTAVSGDVSLRVPCAKLEALLRSVSGRIRTTNVSLGEGGPLVKITGVSADLEVINTHSPSQA